MSPAASPGAGGGGGDRLPPGQYDEPGFPVLTAGPTPDVDTAEWTFRIDGVVAEEAEWTWDEFHELEFEQIPCDIHCVTSWSKLGTSFGGVSMDRLLDRAEPLGAYAMAFSYGGYTTNLAIEDLTDGKAWQVEGGDPESSRRVSLSVRRMAGGPACVLMGYLITLAAWLP